MEELNKLPDIMTIQQLAEALQVKELTIRRALYSERLKGYKAGKQWRIGKKDVIEWLEKK